MARRADRPPPLDPAVAAAHATLLRGAAFVARQADAGAFSLDASIADEQRHRYRSKTIANALRELDRFLNLLADATARSLGDPLPEGQRNTANKLRDFDAFAIQWDDYERLVALGRSRACLFYRGGQVSSGDRRGEPTFTAGWSARTGPPDQLSRMAIGDRLAVGEIELRDIAQFYERLALRLQTLAAAAVNAD